MLYLIVFTQLRTQNRCAPLLELLYMMKRNAQCQQSARRFSRKNRDCRFAKPESVCYRQRH
jgi:hypothetical protein